MGGLLEGRVALVAGASGPIGRAVCRSLASNGAAVAVHHHTGLDRAEGLAAELPGGALVVGGDLRSPSTVEQVASAVEARLGPVHVLVNAAHTAAMAPAPVADTSPADLAAQLAAVEVHAALCARLIPGMRAEGWGRIVYVAGALMARPAAGFGAYGAAKAAASVLTRYVALEEGRAGITANVVAPGRVVEPGAGQQLSPEQRHLAERLAERMALPAPPTPAEVAEVVLGLVGPSGAPVTGQTVWVTGGEPMPC